MSSNERGSERARALALACGGDPAYELKGFAEIPVDMRLELPDPEELMPRAAVNVELKEIPDFWSSKASGHLGQQVLGMLQAHEPGFIAVFGSLQEVLGAVPKIKMAEGKPRHRSQMDVASDINTARAFCGDAAACGVPVHFLSQSYEQSFRWVLSYAKNILMGPSLASWLPRYQIDPKCYGSLCSIRNIGDASAKKIISTVGEFNQLPWKNLTVDELVSRIGKAKASAIVDVYLGGNQC